MLVAVAGETFVRNTIRPWPNSPEKTHVTVNAGPGSLRSLKPILFTTNKLDFF